jgi:DNA polymerase-4
VIAHLDLDAFYASVELLRRPELAGKPVIVSGSGPRAVVTTASYEARAFGVHSAMPTSRARRLCPQGILIAPDFAAYRAASQAVWAVVGEHVEVVERLGLDEGYLDLSELASPKAAMRRLVADVAARTRLTASVGIGPNKLVAKVASDAEKPRGFVVLSREMACERFGARSPRLIPGIGGKTAERLEALGIATIAQLAATPDALLAERFGDRWGPWLAARARFCDDAPVITERVAVSESRETTFDVDIGERSAQQEALRRLAGELAAGLRRHDRRGRTIAIKVRLDDFTTVTRAKTLSQATCDERTIADLACALLEEYDPPRPVRLLGVRVASFEDPDGPAAGEPTAQLALPL